MLLKSIHIIQIAYCHNTSSSKILKKIPGCLQEGKDFFFFPHFVVSLMPKTALGILYPIESFVECHSIKVYNIFYLPKSTTFLSFLSMWSIHLQLYMIKWKKKQQEGHWTWVVQHTGFSRPTTKFWRWQKAFSERLFIAFFKQKKVLVG